MTPATALERGLSELALSVPPGSQEKLLAYVDLLAKWNRVYNLTAIRDPLEMITHHVLDSLSVAQHLPVPQHPSLADVGSGGGLPGIPLAIVRPEWRLTLNDSLEKKAAFLRQAKIELGLQNIEVYEGRAESWRPASLFNVVVSRAFAELRDFVSICTHLVTPGGWLAAMKGARPADADACDVVRLKVPFVDAQRHLVLCKVA